MKKSVLILLFLAGFTASGQIADGGYNHFHMTSSVMVSADSIAESAAPARRHS